ncbi:TonB-dependent receptor plug domain-containing protein [Flavobacterium arcticum]|uniref:alpha-2-macroglobulin family protein n=1 Tax=Flavobacterium arcticum TaxID=1784713 RepID=UPI0013C2CD5A|nr:MG2 domain-containing protein [Flavobacterium arcticum]KAF2509698.1 TonB-dependent receptor plug domain-containing protein [Flavobacterium arcticum]
MEKKSFFILQTTDVALLEESYYNTYTVVNRVNGKPIKRAKIIHDNITTYTDRNGKANITTKEYGNQAITVTYSKDTLNANGYLYTYNNELATTKNTESSYATTQIYLDRAIYRPGQTVYFKGIVTEEITKSNGQKSASVVPDIYINIKIEDNDYEIMKTMRIKTNEFGSFTSEFTIPRNVMTGRFTINILEDYDYEEDEHPFWDKENFYFEETSASFQVEEYKRPTFEASFTPFTDVVKINDSITVKGSANALNGSPLIGAKVRYNISRTSYGYYNYHYNNKDYITKGEVITDSNGNFKIPFVAVVDTAIAPEKLPVFTFSINCEVTDITGETHECDTRVYVGYHSLQLNVTSPVMLNSTSEEASIMIKTENLNNQFVPAECDVKIYKLTNNNSKRILHQRPWSEPEIQAIPESEFIEKFPHTTYKEVTRNDLPREKMVFSRTLITKENEKLSIENYKDWETGEYELYVTTKDSSGNIFEEKTYFSFKKEEDLSGPYAMLYEIKNTDYNKDGYVALQLYTALPELYVNINTMYNNGIFYTEWHKLTKGNKIIKIPINKKWKGEVSLFIEYIWENEYEKKKFDIKINPAIEPITFHTNVINNKLLPGKKETWSFTLKNSNELPAEVLASMYDASLDEFEYSYWNSSLINYRSNNYIPYKTLSTTGLVRTNYIYSYLPRINIIKPLDFIKTYGLDINNKEIDFYTQGIKNEKEVMSNGGFILTGTVSDKIGPLPSASVTVKGTLRNVRTDIDGNFSIPVVMGETLNFDYVSFNTVTMVVNSTMPVNIILEGQELEMVIIDKYTSTVQRSTTAAITTISVEDRANASILQSLQGQVAGLNIGTGSGQPGADSTIILRGVGSIDGNVQPLFVVDGIPVDEDGFRSISVNDIGSYSILKDAAATSIYGNRGANGVIIITTLKGMIEQLDELGKVESRKNLQETAFFYPQILTDKEGNFNFTFTSPEALTSWNFRLLAHNKKAQSGYFQYLALTQKDLMIMPNMPRFLREGDEITITAKVTNMTAEVKIGNAMLQLYDAATMQPIDEEALQTAQVQPFNLGVKANTTVSWKIKVPLGLQGVQYKVVAKSGDFSDGEESILPVFSNRTLVTESIPLWVKGNTVKEYTLENLKNNTSSTLVHHGITLEYTSNPAWIALQSLPYLMEFEHECSEQLFSRYYANAIATHILESNPKIAEVFGSWRKSDKSLSKLEQNEELKSIIMAESPWMLDNQSDEERKNRIALLFELDKMKTALKINLNKLDNRQMASGGYAWFEGGNENEYITRHIMAGLGHINKLGIVDEENTIDGITKTGVKFIDDLFWKRYKERERDKNKSKYSFIDSAKELHYHYARSFYLEQYPMNDSLKKTTQKHLDIYKKNWLNYSLYEKGLTALVLQRYGEEETAKIIVQSLRDTSANNDENGMYWLSNKAGWHWYNSPIETQALLIEAFTEIDNDTKAVDGMKVWLIKNKQNKNWPTTKSTTEAVYALMMTGSDWLSVKDSTTITLGSTTTFNKKMQENEKEAGTGYIKMHWQGSEVTKDMAALTIENKTEVPGYGGLYWQYFEDADKVKTVQKGIMNLSRELFVKVTTTNGVKLKKVTDDNPMKIGDKVTMRLVLDIKEDMEYVHLKDVRAAAFEPVDVLSKYEYKDGLGYYRSTRDAATHFFFDRINKGTYVLEYDVRVNNIGEFSNGISTIQSMYAPEFSGHSEGIRVKTEE